MKTFFKSKSINKKTVLFFLLVLMCSFATFAKSSTDYSSVNTAVTKLVSFFNSGWVKGVACIALIGECLGLLLAGGQNPQILKKFLPFIAGTVLFMCAGKLVNIFMGDMDESEFAKDLDLTTSYLLPSDNQNDSFELNLKSLDVEFIG